ncbi:MAG TPA: hypothetical protein DGG94_15940 [Micromonosporaceae bacterium]|nr:hypothetical protein [Micromonosporaceae bacterium]
MGVARLHQGCQQGPAARAAVIVGEGQVWAKNPAWRIGDVIKVSGFAEDKYVVVRQNDLAWVNQFQATMLGSGRSGSENLSDLGKLATINDLQPKAVGPQEPPVDLPRIATYTGGGLCSVVKDEAGNSELRSEVQLDLSKRPQTAGRSKDGVVYADYILVPHGRGAIVASGQTFSLVAPDGVRYAAANPAVLGKLGYDGKAPVRLPPVLISLLPEGPGLDPQEALVQLTVS